MFFKEIECPNCKTYHDPTLQECPDCHKSNELFKLNRLPKKVAFLHPVAQVGMFIAGFAYAGMLLIEYLYANFGSAFDGDKIYKTTIIMLLTYSTMFLILASIIVFTRKKDFFSKFKSGTDYIYGIGYAFTVMFVSAIVMNICSIFYNAQDNTNQTTATLVATNYPLLSFIVIGFLGPICEELTYRVGLYSFLRRINKYVAIIATSLVFAFIHFEVGAENIVNELWSMPAYFVSGLIFCIAYEHRGPACSITAHMVYNMLAFVMMFVQK